MNKEQRDLIIGEKGHPMTWMRYHRYRDIIRYMEFLAFTYPRQVESLTIGYTTEGLPLRVLKVSSQSSGRSDHSDRKPAFWIDGGLFADIFIITSYHIFLQNRNLYTIFCTLITSYHNLQHR